MPSICSAPTAGVRGHRRTHPPRPPRRSLLRALVLAALVLAALPAAAGAHAQLESTYPGRDTLVKTQPASVYFTFGEPVTGTAGAVRVFDTGGGRADNGDAGHHDGNPTTFGVGLKPNLPDGTYTATYRIVSADTHIVTGGFSFSIGKRTGTTGETVGQLLSGQQTGAVTSDAFILTRALMYAAIAAGSGAIAFLLLVWLPALLGLAGAGGGGGWGGASGAALRRLRRIVLVASVVGFVVALVGIGLEGAEAAGVSFFSALDATIFGDVLSTRFGGIWLGAAVAWLLIGLGALVGLRPREDRLGPPRSHLLVLAVPAAALLFLPAIAGHSGVTKPTWLLVPLNVIHVTAMTVWLGGLLALVLAVPAATRRLEPPDRTRLLAGTLVRFSPIALGCVIALLATGVVQALYEISAWSQLLDTAYGRAVLIKVALLMVLIGLGAQNRQRTVPRLRALATVGDSPGAAGVTLRRALRLEVAVIAVVLVVTGALAGYPPAKTVGTGPPNVTTTLGPEQMQITVDPGRVGANEIHVYLLDPKTGAQFAGSKQFTITATLPSKGIGPLPLDAEVAGPGHYVISQAVLAAPGTWTIDVVDRVSEFDQYEQKVKVKIR